MKRISLILPTILTLCFSANAQSEIDRGVVHDGTYINSSFGFSYKYPKDWVVHGDATNERIRELGKEKIVQSGAISETSAEVSLKHTYHLLTVFRQPVGTPGIAINPAVLVIAEKVTHAPGIKSGKDYLLNVRELLRKSETQFLLKEPAECQFGGWQFFRDDYGAGTNGVPAVQSYFASIANGYAVVFIFMGEDQKSVDEMSKSMETFALAPPVRKGVTVTLEPAPKPKPN
jgi:hypothetical protein